MAINLANNVVWIARLQQGVGQGPGFDSKSGDKGVTLCAAKAMMGTDMCTYSEELFQKK
jgi:hypothetical protein